jgi:hypothetical protein
MDEEELEQQYERQTIQSNFRNKMFNEMTKSLEAKQYAQSIFVQKFERLDMEFLNQSNIY